MEKIKYKGQVYVRIDNDDDESFTSTEKAGIKKGIGFLEGALGELRKAHKAFVQVGALSGASYADINNAEKICSKVIRQVNQAMRS